MSIFLKNDLMARRRASASYADFLKVLIKTGEVKMLETVKRGYKHWLATKGLPDTIIKDPAEALKYIGGDGVSVKFEYNGEIYTSYFADGDYVTDSDKFGPFEDFFTSFVSEMKEAGEYYIPHTTIPWWKAPILEEAQPGKYYIPGTAIPWYKTEDDAGWFSIAKDENGGSFAVDCLGNATKVVEKAKAEMKNGYLHLDVPETAMGEIIGKRGAHIKATEAALRQKGLPSLKKIILHPHQ